MSDPRYLRDDLGSLLGHVVEECGEVLAAIGKTQRWGLDSSNPEVLPGFRETNRTWLLRELDDLEFTIARLRKGITP
jgi:NTP pyrophosphatase (non-canonical NTP hydrolase)